MQQWQRWLYNIRRPGGLRKEKSFTVAYSSLKHLLQKRSEGKFPHILKKPPDTMMKQAEQIY